MREIVIPKITSNTITMTSNQLLNYLNKYHPILKIKARFWDDSPFGFFKLSISNIKKKIKSFDNDQNLTVGRGYDAQNKIIYIDIINQDGYFAREMKDIQREVFEKKQ